MAEVLHMESDTNHRYRITRTDRGVLLSCMQKDQVGLLLGPSEWLYRTEEAAEKGLKVVMLMNAWWTAITRGYPAGDLPQKCDAASAAHTEAIERLNDQPSIGNEVRELRLLAEFECTTTEVPSDVYEP